MESEASALAGDSEKMCKWNESSKKIDIAFSANRRFMCVEHPALISCHDKALETLGGHENLEQIYSEKAKRLPLCWRPSDIYCKPTYGDRCTVSNLLMKVHRRRRKSDGHEEYSVEIIGHIDTTYKFQSLCDFQYLPVRRTKNNTYEDLYNKIVIQNLVLEKEYMTSDVPLFIPPILFSRVDKPCELSCVYKADIVHRNPDYKDPDKARPSNYIGTIRQRRSIFTIFVNFGEEVPKVPMPEAVEQLNADFVDKEKEKVLIQLFEKKPLYLKVELEHLSGVTGVKLKRYLPAMCFYWLDGPWRGQWNKFGFDPTTDSSAKIYQTVDFRIRQLQPGQMDIKAKRDTYKMIHWTQIHRAHRQTAKISLQALDDNAPATAKNSNYDEDKELQYKFRPDKIPPQRMMYYPVCYVEVEEVQKLVHSNDGQETKCTEKDGWCVPHFNDRCRDIMYKYVNRLLSTDQDIDCTVHRSKKKKRYLQKLRQAEGADSEEDMDQTSSNVRQRKNVSSTDRQMEEAGDGEINEEMEVDT